MVIRKKTDSSHTNKKEQRDLGSFPVPEVLTGFLKKKKKFIYF